MINREFREGCIILPDAAGPVAHERLADALAAAFGGYTRFSGMGAWRASADAPILYEAIKKYVVAAPATAATQAALLRIAQVAARAYGRRVYFRDCAGEVQVAEAGDA